MLRYRLPVLALVLLPACWRDPIGTCPGCTLKQDTLVSTLLDVGGASVQGMAFLAEDSVMYPGNGGLHPTAVLIPDVWNSGALQYVARGLRVRGWNAITYDHRGTWASLGSFTLMKSLQADIDWMVPNLRAEWAVNTWGVAGNRITLIGHQWGGGAALAAAARDPAVRCVAGLAPLNIGFKGRLAGESTAYLDATIAEVRGWMRTANVGDPLHVRLGTTPELFVEELIARAAEFDVTLLAPRLAGRPVLLVGTTTLYMDTALHQAAMRDALVKAGARVTDTIINVRHSDFATMEDVLVATVNAWLLRERCGG